MTEPKSSHAPSSGSLEPRLNAAWARERWFHLTRGLTIALPVLTGIVLLDFLLDWCLDLPGYGRVLLLLANLAALAWIFWTHAGRYLRPYDPLVLALRLEKQHPALNSVLVSAVQLDEADVQSGVSPALVRAVKRAARELTEGMDFGQIVSFRKLSRMIFLAGADAMFAAACIAAQPQFAWTLACRLANPWSTHAYPTRTRIEVLTKDTAIRQSASMQLLARASGAIPEKGTVQIKFPDVGWEKIELPRSGASDFTYLLEQVSSDLDYRFKLGDAISPVYHVSAVRPPQMVEESAKLDYPAYTHLVPEAAKTLNVKVPESTQIHWQLKFDRPIAHAELVLENLSPVPMTLGSEGQTVALTMPAESSSSYRFQYTWQFNGRECVETGPKRFMQVIPDLDPHVELAYPVEDEKATLGKVLSLKIHAQDDYGLENATIVYAINDGLEQRRPAVSLNGARAIDKELTWAIKDSIPGLKLGDVLTVAVIVADGRAGQPGITGHVARTKSRRVQFVSAKEYEEYVLGRQRRYLGLIRPLYRHEREALDRIRDLQSAMPASRAIGTP